MGEIKRFFSFSFHVDINKGSLIVYKLKFRVHANKILSLKAILRFWINSKCHYIQMERSKRTQQLYRAGFSLCRLIENLSYPSSQTPPEPIKSACDRVIHL